MKNKIFNLHLFSSIVVATLGGVVGQQYSSNIRCLGRERQALLIFKDELVDEYGRLSSWGVGKNKRECCKWRGVHCHNRTNHVTKLNLRAPQGRIYNPFWIAPLKGKISSSLLELKHLTHLDLSKNDFGHSNLPEFIGSFQKLQYLNLSNANFSKSIPPSVGNLSKLIYLDFRWNDALYSTDNLDWVSHLGSLKYLDLSEVRLGNASNWLQAISKLTSIEEIHLHKCYLQDIIPSSLPSINASAPLAILDLSDNVVLSSSTLQWFLNFSKSLTFVDLSYNSIKSLVSTFGFDNQIFLSHLDLFANALQDGIPKSFGNLSSLAYLDLKNNLLTAQLSELTMNLSGPMEKKLEHLNLRNNMISGSLPDFSRFSFLNHLNLGRNKLNGAIAKGFLNIPYLEILDLSYNSLLTLNFSSHWIPPFQLRAIGLSQCNIGRRFPGWLRFQRRLEHLDISFSHIADTIPSWFGNVASRLTLLNASNNQIHGVFPINIGFSTSTRAILDLSRNKITGQATFLCRYVGWVLIDLSDNLFSGDLPNCLASYSQLLFLNLASNNFSGGIPNSFGSLRYLHLLNLRNNSLSGGLPTSIRNCTSLEMIDVGENRLTGNIPTWIGDNLVHLNVLSLRFNEFRGTIPRSICSLQKIRVLDFSSNKISGVIPQCLHNLTAMADEPSEHSWDQYFVSDYLGTLTLYNSLQLDGVYFTWKGKEVNYINQVALVELIDLSNNVLMGDIPSELTKLVALVQLNLSRNNLTGFIPQSIGLMKSLDSLDLSRNHLSGGIPNSISELSFLGILNLSYNNLSRRIPPQILKFDESSYTGNSGLCGRPILNKSCPGEDGINQGDSNFNSDGIAHPSMSNSEHEDYHDGFITKGFYICMGFGFIVGFWGIFGTILLSKSTRYAYFKLLNRIEDFVYVKVKLSKAHLKRRFQNQL